MILRVHWNMLNVLYVIVKLVNMVEEFMHAFTVKLHLSVRMINLHMKLNVMLK